MKASYSGNPEINQDGDLVQDRSIELPFESVAVRAVIIRRKDGAFLGVLYEEKENYVLPGELIANHESSDNGIIRILEETNIILINSDKKWRDRLTVDYFHGFRSLSLWYVFMVDDVQLGESENTSEIRWLDQSQDVWYPNMREKICLAVKENVPDLLQINLHLESW